MGDTQHTNILFCLHGRFHSQNKIRTIEIQLSLPRYSDMGAGGGRGLWAYQESWCIRPPEGKGRTEKGRGRGGVSAHHEEGLTPPDR